MAKGIRKMIAEKPFNISCFGAIDCFVSLEDLKFDVGSVNQEYNKPFNLQIILPLRIESLLAYTISRRKASSSHEIKALIEQSKGIAAQERFFE